MVFDSIKRSDRHSRPKSKYQKEASMEKIILYWAGHTQEDNFVLCKND